MVNEDDIFSPTERASIIKGIKHALRRGGSHGYLHEDDVYNSLVVRQLEKENSVIQNESIINPSSYWFGVGSKFAISMIRSESKHKHESLDFVSDDSDPRREIQEDNLVNNLENLDRIVAMLPNDLRKVVELTFGIGVKKQLKKDIAAILKISAPTLRKRLSTAIQILQSQYMRLNNGI